MIQQAKIEYLEHANHIWFLHEERNLLINEEFLDCVFIHKNYEEYFESPNKVEIDRDEIFSILLYLSTQINKTLIKLTANPKSPELTTSISKTLLLIAEAYKWRPYHEHERKAAVLVENIEYSARMFKDILEESKLVDDFEAVLKFITPTSESFLLEQPQS